MSTGLFLRAWISLSRFPSLFVLLFGNDVWVRQVSPELSQKYIHEHLAWCLPFSLGFRAEREGGKSGREAGETGATGILCVPCLAQKVKVVDGKAAWCWGHGSTFQASMGHGHVERAQTAGGATATPGLGRSAGRQQHEGPEPVGCVRCHSLKNRTCFLSIGSCGPSKERKVVDGRRVWEPETATFKKCTNKRWDVLHREPIVKLIVKCEGEGAILQIIANLQLCTEQWNNFVKI